MSNVSGVGSVPFSTPQVSSLVDSTNAVNAAQTNLVEVASTNNGQNIDAVSTDFEAVFLTQMMQPMFEGDELTQYFGGGTAGEVYKSYFLNELGKSIAKSGGIGIAAQVKQELLKLQEIKP